MDFRPSEEQTALCALAREILAKEATPERLRAAERSPEWFDRVLWARLADANLLGVALPEAYGGIGLGFFELCALCVELGRALAPLPAVPALAMGGLAIARFGSQAQQARWLAPLARGEIVLTAALEPGPAVRARSDGPSFVLDGSRACVPAVHLAERVMKQKLSTQQYNHLERLAEGIVRAVHQTADNLGWDNATKKEVALLKLQEVAQKYNIKLSPGFADTLIEAAVSLVKEQLKWAGLPEEKKVDKE